MRRRVGLAVIAAVAIFAFGPALCGKDSPNVSFSSPKDGATVASPVRLQMTARGITVEPAGAMHKGAGHFHVLVDRDCAEPGTFIEVNTAGFEHYGKGQATAELVLPPGRHTLCLQLGDGAHTALDPTDEITITVAD